jgi:hypothetical protein
MTRRIIMPTGIALERVERSGRPVKQWNMRKLNSEFILEVS